MRPSEDDVIEFRVTHFYRIGYFCREAGKIILFFPSRRQISGCKDLRLTKLEFYYLKNCTVARLQSYQFHVIYLALLKNEKKRITKKKKN